MRNKYTFGYVLIIILVLMTAGAFYWFQYRPSVAKQECHKYADERSRDGNLNDSERYDFRYKFCLQEKGIR